MSYPYPPMGPGEQPSGGRPGGWSGSPPPSGGYGPSAPDWQHQETMAAGTPMMPPMTPPQMGQPVGQPPMGPMGPPPMGPPPRNGGGGMIVVAIAAAVVVVGGILGGAYFVASRGGDDGKGSSTSPAAVASPSGQPAAGGQPGSTAGHYKPAYYDGTKSWSLWDKLNTAAGDSKPMTLSEVFGDPRAKSQSNSIEGITMNLAGAGRLDSDCGGAVWGPGLKAAMQADGCTQVVRAAYVSTDQRWVGQLAIFNLRDVNAANALLQDLDPKAGKGFFLPVSGPSPVDRFGKGTTGASGGAYGHFVVMGWAGHADGSQGDSYGTDTIAPSSLVQRAGKEFLFTRNTG